MPDKKESDFKCKNCQKMISGAENIGDTDQIGTRHRNHCPFCLWSLHVDEEKSGDRASKCQGSMEPIGLTFKNEGVDKYSKPKQGEIMLIHRCISCGKISINRIAGDDDASEIKQLFEKSCGDHQLRKTLQTKDIKFLDEDDEKEVLAQLFGEK